MINYFCDYCDKEIERNYIDERIKRTIQHEGKNVSIEIILAGHNPSCEPPPNIKTKKQGRAMLCLVGRGMAGQVKVSYGKSI